jgi:biopolymer transport protein ExbD
VKLGSPIEEKRARIEIIPLIDIMFFLLACFMAVSLSMIQMRGMKISLPTAVNTQPESHDDFTTITVDAAATVFLEKDRIDEKAELTKRVRALHDQNQDLRIYVRADKDATHGEVIGVLDAVRSAGVNKVAFELQAKTQVDPNKVPPAATSATPAVPPAPAPPAPPAPIAPEPQ